MQPTSKTPKRTASGAQFFLTIIASQAITHPSAAAAATTCTTPCECSEQLRQAREHYTAKLADSQNNAVTHGRQILKLLIATTGSNKQLQKAAAPVFAAEITSWAKCLDATEQLSAAYREHVPTIAQAERALGMVATLSELNGEVKLQAKAGTGQLTDSSVLTESLWQGGDDRCKITNAEEGKHNFDAANKSGKMTLKEFPTTATIGLLCDSNGAGQNCHTTGLPNGSGGLTFTLKLTHDAPARNDAGSKWNSQQSPGPVYIKNKMTLLHNNISAAGVANQALQQAFSQYTCDAASTDYSAFTSSEHFSRQVIRTLSAAATNEKATTNSPKDLEMLIESAYGKNGQKFKENLWDQIDKLTPTVNKGETSEKLNLKTEKDISKLGEALARQLGSIRKETEAQASEAEKKTNSGEATEEKKDGDHKPTAGECKATEADKCDKTKCDWNKEKNECKVKEGSFIISAATKVPVFFAVLLLK
uniref:Variant surface glycoprotein 1125.4680 n=1 Tax=Trypanosoma brucei TaxID=5691 RepID=A0A1J0RAN1_9TRYP|nr:variant surface glycoprotein 1125.4680 [Trypanosoma brucei]